jgi:hypothetical protein
LKPLLCIRHHIGPELTAGRGNILSLAVPDNGGIIVFAEDIFEVENCGFFRSLKFAILIGIKGD